LDQDLTVGRVFKFNLKCLKCSVEVNGKVMRQSSQKEELNGYGVMFVKLTDAEKMGINAIIKDLEKGGARDFSREGDGTVPADSEVAERTHQRKTAARYKLLHEAILTSEIRIREQAKNKYHPHFFMEYIAAALIGYTNRMRMSVIGSLVKILWAPKSGIRLMMEPRRILDTGDKT
ncbi:unnamed protein product, partial [marine sediment metagenome]